MTYKVEIKRSANKKLMKLDRYASAYIIAWIEKNLVNNGNPRAIGKALQGNKKDLWRYRVGDYRIIADIQDEKVTILIVDLGHRRDIYKR